jgi:hypothetical protein
MAGIWGVTLPSRGARARSLKNRNWESQKQKVKHQRVTCFFHSLFILILPQRRSQRMNDFQKVPDSSIDFVAVPRITFPYPLFSIAFFGKKARQKGG